MFSRVFFVWCTAATVAYAAAFVGVALGIALSRASRGEPGSSWLLTLIGLTASVAFGSLLCLTYFGAFDRPVIAGGLDWVMVLLALGVGFAMPSVIRSDHARVAVVGAGVSTFLGLGLMVTVMVAVPGLRKPSTAYLLNSLAPMFVGVVVGWIQSGRQDLDDLLDAELATHRTSSPF